jgi:hypothetical protein
LSSTWSLTATTTATWSAVSEEWVVHVAVAVNVNVNVNDHVNERLAGLGATGGAR